MNGEKDDLVLHSLPNPHDTRWPEFDKELNKHQIELLKMYTLVDVIPSGVNAAGAGIVAPGGQESWYREGEPVAAGFRVVEINVGATSVNNAVKVPPSVTLQKAGRA